LTGLNVALAWHVKEIEIMCDSATVCSWVKSVVTGDKRVHVHAFSETMVKRRSFLLEQLIQECEIELKISLVKSTENKADELTRVLAHWW